MPGLGVVSCFPGALTVFPAPLREFGGSRGTFGRCQARLPLSAPQSSPRLILGNLSSALQFLQSHALALRQRTGPGILVRILPDLGRHGLEERSLVSTPFREKSPHYPAAGSSLGRGFSPRSCRSGGRGAGRSGEDLGGSWSLRKKTREASLNTCLSPVIGAVRAAAAPLGREADPESRRGALGADTVAAAAGAGGEQPL